MKYSYKGKNKEVGFVGTVYLGAAMYQASLPAEDVDDEQLSDIQKKLLAAAVLAGAFAPAKEVKAAEPPTDKPHKSAATKKEK